MTNPIARALAWVVQVFTPRKTGKHAARPVDNTQPVPTAHDVTNDAHGDPDDEPARKPRPAWWPPMPSAFEPVWDDEYNVRPFIAALPPNRKLDPKEERRQEEARQVERRAALYEASLLPVGHWSSTVFA